MSVDVLLGCQWGDEGKAKMIDCLSCDYDIIARFQGGANSGHTVIHKDKKFVFHLLPSGVFFPDTICVMCNGMVIDLGELIEEIDMIKKHGTVIDHRLKISSDAFLVLPIHKEIDKCREENAIKKIGSTKKGIGPAYGDKVLRQGLRIKDLANRNFALKKLEEFLCEKEAIFHAYGRKLDINMEKMLDELIAQYKVIERYLINTTFFLHDARKQGKTILLEGAQGTGLDIDYGTYPFVTSSSCISAGACQGTGLAPNQINKVFGIFKLYATRVGEGLLPTQLLGEDMLKLQHLGGEFGATTGRPRRCGWFDLVQAKYAVMINGVTDFVLTKVDILDDMDFIPIGVAYEIDGQRYDRFQLKDYGNKSIKVIYKNFPGWKQSTKNITDWKKAPKALVDIVSFLEEQLEIPVSFISTGASREQLIRR